MPKLLQKILLSCVMKKLMAPENGKGSLVSESTWLVTFRKLLAFVPNYSIVFNGWQPDSKETRQFLLKTIISMTCRPVKKKKV